MAGDIFYRRNYRILYKQVISGLPRLQRKLLKITIIGKYNRTTVPGEVRKLLGLKEGDKIAWYYENGKIIVTNPKESE